MLRVAIITKSELDKNDKTNWFEFLVMLKNESIQPLLVLPFLNDHADELTAKGIIPLCFPIERGDCLAGKKRFVQDFARFLSHIKVDVVISMNGNSIEQLEAATLARIPVLIQSPSIPEKFYEAIKIILSCLKLGHGKVFVPTELSKKQLIRRLDHLDLIPLVLPSPFTSCGEDITKCWAKILTAEKYSYINQERVDDNNVQQNSINKIPAGLSIRAGLQNPLLESSDLDLCYRIPDYPYISPPPFSHETEPLLIESSPVQTVLNLVSDHLSRLSLMFLIHRRIPCICAMRFASLKLTLRSTFNLDFPLREIEIPFKDIHNLQWTEISFDPLEHVNQEGIIAELSIPEQVQYLLEVKTFIKKNGESSKQPVLYTAN